MASVINAFNITRTGLQLQEMNLSIKAQNIAAQGADGYKRQYLVAYDLPYQDLGGVGSPTSDNGSISPTGLQVGLGVQAGGIYRIFDQGTPVQTNNPLDLMIEGDGFFEVNMPDGTTSYTRVGALQLNASNTLVMPKTGYVVAPGITLPANTLSVSINQFGQVYVQTQGQTTDQLVGQIELSTFFNPAGLKAIGDSMFQQTSASGTPDKGPPGSNRRGMIKQGWREGSNVNAVEEITDLIKIEKIYEMLTKVLKTGDAMLEKANQIGR
ncbi:MAG: flagellar basal-body rod protein FlgG [Alphaproteobacteria bacterium]|nr:flagellar basal-body rod protein FlgG [Alphaproteobacteria bacterium]